VNSTKLGKQMDAFESDDSTAKRDPEEIIEILRLEQVRPMTGLCRSSIYQMEAQGRFPRRNKIGVRAVGWAKGDVQKWLRSRVDASAAPGSSPPSS